MEKKIMVGAEELQVQDGRVTILSEELARAIQEQEVDLAGDEEANAIVNIQFKCQNGG